MPWCGTVMWMSQKADQCHRTLSSTPSLNRSQVPLIHNCWLESTSSPQPPVFTVLDGEVAELQADIGGLSAQQLKIYALRANEREIFPTTKEDLEHEVPLLPTMALRADPNTVVLRRCAYRDLLSEVSTASAARRWRNLYLMVSHRFGCTFHGFLQSFCVLPPTCHGSSLWWMHLSRFPSEFQRAASHPSWLFALTQFGMFWCLSLFRGRSLTSRLPLRIVGPPVWGLVWEQPLAVPAPHHFGLNQMLVKFPLWLWLAFCAWSASVSSGTGHQPLSWCVSALPC